MSDNMSFNLFLAIKQFIISFVLNDESESSYTADKIVIGQQNNFVLDKENNQIIMTLLQSESPILCPENYTVQDKVTFEYHQVYHNLINYKLQIDFLGDDGFGAVNKFRNCINTRSGCIWLLRKFNLVITKCEVVNNVTNVLDQMEYVAKFTAQADLQGIETVRMPLYDIESVETSTNSFNNI